IIRLLADFSRSDKSVFGSILIEDIAFTLVFILISIVTIKKADPIIVITISIVIAGLIGGLSSIFVFKKKFSINKKQIYGTKLKLSFSQFKTDLGFSVIKGPTVFLMYAVRFFGFKFFGENMVAETHILIQLYNIFNLMSISIISGFQALIVLGEGTKLNLKKVSSLFKSIQFPSIYVSFGVLLVMFVYSQEILQIIAPNFSYLYFE